jgi:phosphatidylglycerophosphate synthase
MAKKSIYSDQNGNNLLAYPEPWSVKIFRFFAIPLAKGLAKIKVHPNVITILTIPFAFVAAFFFFNNMLIYGAVFFFISFLLDCADGTLARLTNKQSEFGEKLDKYTDRINNFAMYFGLWYSQYYLTGYEYEGAAIFAAHYLIMLFGLLFITSYDYKTIGKSISSYYAPLDEAFLTFFILPIFGVFFYVFPILVIIQLISHIGLLIKQRKNKKV